MIHFAGRAVLLPLEQHDVSSCGPQAGDSARTTAALVQLTGRGHYQFFIAPRSTVPTAENCGTGRQQYRPSGCRRRPSSMTGFRESDAQPGEDSSTTPPRAAAREKKTDCTRDSSRQRNRYSYASSMWHQKWNGVRQVVVPTEVRYWSEDRRAVDLLAQTMTGTGGVDATR